MFKIPVLGELLASFDVIKGSVRGFLDLAMYRKRLVTADMVNETWPRPPTGSIAGNPAAGAPPRLGPDPGRLGSTSTPTLILLGNQDRVLASWQASRLARSLPHAVAYILAGCGYLLELDCPGQANRYLASFLAPG